MDYDKYRNTLPYIDDVKAWRAESARLEALFKADALADVGLTGHPKADRAYAMAWDRGHASGYSEVYNELVDLAELLLD